MATYFVMKVPGVECSRWNSLEKARSECDAAKSLYPHYVFVVEKRETVYSSETLDDLLKA